MTDRFATLAALPDKTVIAPDGSQVRILLGLRGGGMARFELAAGQVAAAVRHRTVEEIWYVLSGVGQMWRRQGDCEEFVSMSPGVCLTLPVGTAFQFRNLGNEPLIVLGVTMPPWPGPNEAEFVPGPWEASCSS